MSTHGYGTGGEKPRAAATDHASATGHDPSPTSILDSMNQLKLAEANWHQSSWVSQPGYVFLPEPVAAAPARLHLVDAPQVPQPQMPPLPPMPSSGSSGMGTQMAAAFSGYFGGRGGRGGRHGEKGEKALRPKLGPCLPGGGGKRGPPAPPKAAGRPSSSWASSSTSSAPSCPVSPHDPVPQPSLPPVGKLFQGLLLPQQQLPPVPSAPLSSESLFQMAFDPDDVGRAIVQAHGEPHQALGLLLHAGKTRIRAMQERLDRIAAVHPSAEASLPMPPLPPSGPHEDPIARPGDPGVAPGRVKKKRLAPRHKRDVISLLDDEEAQPVDAEQEAQDGERSDPAMASTLRAPPERAGAGAGAGWPMA